MEVADRQQVGFALCQSDTGSGTLALGAVTVATTVVGNALMPTILTGIDVFPIADMTLSWVRLRWPA